jgi:hypothetical protein
LVLQSKSVKKTHSLLLHAHATSSSLAFRGTYIYGNLLIALCAGGGLVNGIQLWQNNKNRPGHFFFFAVST